MQPTIEEQAVRAAGGDEAALEAVVRGIQDRVYRLAMRMLGHPDNARDATQEILIRVVTRLSSFRSDSKLSTWVYRIASNYLVDDARRTAREALTFGDLDAMLAQPANAIEAATLQAADRDLVIEETFIGCTQGMLLCLDREHRAAFIVGAILELDGHEAAHILGIGEAAYRKRLSRARARLRDFMGSRCGVVNPDAPCRCEYQVNLNVERGYLRPDGLRLATHARAHVREIRGLADDVTVFRRHPLYAAPDFVARLDGIVRMAPGRPRADSSGRPPRR